MFMHEEENEDDIMSTIKKLMEELASKMEYSSDDFEERLGRKKPAVEISMMKSDKPVSHDDVEDAEAVMFPKEEAEEMEDCDYDDEDEDKSGLKDRLMKLRRG